MILFSKTSTWRADFDFIRNLYDDLSRIAYNALRQHGGRLFYVINFEKIVQRSNPLEPDSMTDITDAIQSSRTIMLGFERMSLSH